MHRTKLFRSGIVFLLTGAVIFFAFSTENRPSQQVKPISPAGQSSLATTILKQLPVSRTASKEGYDRKQFSDGWAKVDTCTIRDKILARDMTDVRFRAPGDCTVTSGVLNDPYTGKTIHFVRGPATSSAVQIDHVVAVSDAWQTGAQQLAKSQREELYNDSLELIAVDGPANEQKGDGDASEWLPSNQRYDCAYVARQIAVKKKYNLWVTLPEEIAMKKVLSSCPGQLTPTVKSK